MIYESKITETKEHLESIRKFSDFIYKELLLRADELVSAEKAPLFIGARDWKSFADSLKDNVECIYQDQIMALEEEVDSLERSDFMESRRELSSYGR